MGSATIIVNVQLGGFIVNSEELEKLKGGDTEAFSNIIDEFSNLVFKVSYNVLNNRELSNECVNETFF